MQWQRYMAFSPHNTIQCVMRLVRPCIISNTDCYVELVVYMWIILEHDISTYIHSLVAMQVVGPMWTE